MSDLRHHDYLRGCTGVEYIAPHSYFLCPPCDFITERVFELRRRLVTAKRVARIVNTGTECGGKESIFCPRPKTRLGASDSNDTLLRERGMFQP